MKKYATLFAVKLLALSISIASYGDDLELYKSTGTAEDKKSNILFILDNSTSMSNRFYEGGAYKTRMNSLKMATKSIFNSLPNDSINIGIMTFDTDPSQEKRGGDWRYRWYHDGGKIRAAVKNLSTTHKDDLINVVNKIKPETNTPLSESLYEAYLYFYGKQPLFAEGYTSSSGIISGNKYKSPVIGTREKNCEVKDSIILFTDGEPTDDTEANSKIESLVAGRNFNYISGNDPLFKECKAFYENEIPEEKRKLISVWEDNGWGNKFYRNNCLDELSWYLGNTDVDPTMDGKQVIKVHTIGGFGMDENSSEVKLLKSTAAYSGGKYASANNTAEIVTAIKRAISDTTIDTSTVSSPSITVNQFSKASHENYTFYAMFKPSSSGKWEGNIKKYQLAARFVKDDGTLASNEELNSVKNAKDIFDVKLFLEDKNNDNILDEAGKVRKETQDLWNKTDVNDGGKVDSGGVRSAMVAQDWSFYTFDENADNNLFTNIDIDNIECNKFNLADGEGCNKIKNFLVGKNERGEILNWLGDIIHSTPTVITYQISYSGQPVFKDAGTDGNAYLFAGSNDGYIHAFDANNGRQKFSFIPEEFYRNIRGYVENNEDEKLYGFDGPITADYDYELTCKQKGTNNDCDSNTDHNSREYIKKIKYANLIVGMRRGGTAYYSLNVKNIDAPRVNWVIRGSALGAKERYGRAIEKRNKGVESIVANNYVFKGTNTAVNSILTYHRGFSELAQTWSKPIIGKVKLSAAAKPIKALIFSGGYDPVNDNKDYTSPTNFTAESKGNAIFIVNAETGELIKKVTGKADEEQSVHLPDMKYSIPGGVAVADKNGDGVIDELFAADVRGNIFRINIPNGNVAEIKASTIASLGAPNRHTRFFTSPRIALVKNPQSILQYAIAIGSGNRANPRDSSMQNGIFVIFQDIDFAKATSKVLGYENLLDIAKVGKNTDLTDEQKAAKAEAKKSENAMSDAKSKIKEIKNLKAAFKRDLLAWFGVKEQFLAIEVNKYRKLVDEHKKIKNDSEQLSRKEIADLESSEKFIDQEIIKLKKEIATETDAEIIKQKEQSVKNNESKKDKISASLKEKKAEFKSEMSKHDDNIKIQQVMLNLYKKKRNKLVKLKENISSLATIDKSSIVGSNMEAINSLTDVELSGSSLAELTAQLGSVVENLKGKKSYANIDDAVASLADTFKKDELYLIFPDDSVDELIGKLSVSVDGEIKKESLNKYLKENDKVKSNLNNLLDASVDVEIRNAFWSQFWGANSKLNTDVTSIDFAEFSKALMDDTYYSEFDSSKLTSGSLIDRVDEAYSQILNKYKNEYVDAENKFKDIYSSSGLKIDLKDSKEIEKAIFAAGGWKKMFEPGWKSLSPVTIRDHKIRFTGFKPNGALAMINSCDPDLGQSWEYSYGLKTAIEESKIRLGVGFYESPQLFRTYYIAGNSGDSKDKYLRETADGKLSSTTGTIVKKPLDCLFGAAGAVEECKDIDVSMEMVYWKNWLETNESYSRVFEDGDDSAASPDDSGADVGSASGKAADPSGS
ncbi:VWA domain-containing protein [Zooshikella marina]|uniref:VWA domain-containing protein n=1 Tax=Zooshikella ganghwensis TaxID=202772 RepID=UPI001BB039DD|nr:VWA domain-containing protein [Zooshikella ganghwensis]MBU2707402.1 VWA domain-containing protein [Zooshikella ganghwensis]